MIQVGSLLVSLCLAAPAQDLTRGERLYLNNCAPCHGPRGDGGKGADLTRPRMLKAPDDQALFNVIRRGLPGTEMPITRHLTDRDIQDVIAFLHTLRRTTAGAVSGDPARGEQLYRGKGHCAQCHTVGGAGGATGPDLSDIGARRSPAYLRESLVDPEAAVPNNYFIYRAVSFMPDMFLQVRVVTKDGRRITGVRVNEDPFSIQLRDASGRLYSFWKDELVELHRDQGKSPMPSYRNTFTAQELDDLVTYLAGLGIER